jgi:peptidoglycan/xylan/chitin deacetylase (PgdA/CDA1 family)
MDQDDTGRTPPANALLTRRGALWLTATTLAMAGVGVAEQVRARDVAARRLPEPAAAAQPMTVRPSTAPPTPSPPPTPSTAPTRPAALTHTTTPHPPPARHPDQTVRLSSMSDGPVCSLQDYTRRIPGAAAFPDDAIMLTIDDGPHPVWTPKILRLLDKYDVKATFCIIGEQARSYPSLVRAVAAEGHHLANHSYTHPINLPWLKPRAMTAQLVDAQDAIVRASGFVPQAFRSPGGSWTPAMMRMAVAHDLLPIDWDVDPRDWSRPGTAHIVQTMLAATPGDMLLCHDGGGDRSQTYAALQTVVPRLKSRGLRFVMLPVGKPARA